MKNFHDYNLNFLDQILFLRSINASQKRMEQLAVRYLKQQGHYHYA